MKKIVFLLSALVLLAVACDKEEPAENKVPEIPTNPTGWTILRFLWLSGCGYLDRIMDLHRVQLPIREPIPIYA